MGAIVIKADQQTRRTPLTDSKETASPSETSKMDAPTPMQQRQQLLERLYSSPSTRLNATLYNSVDLDQPYAESGEGVGSRDDKLS
jgi:hypothetical protein